MPPYKSASGSWYTSALFVEEAIRDPMSRRVIEPVFSLTGREGYIDARATFLVLRDPTGYLWAKEYLKSWQHFEFMLKNGKWFREAYESWCDELKVILKQEAIHKVIEVASSEGPQAFQAAKYLAGAQWETKAGRGRPSKAEVTGELRRRADDLSELEADAQRIGLTIVQGGKV